MLDFILSTCSYGRVTVETIQCVEKLHKTAYEFEWWFQNGDALIARSRCIAVTKFLKEGETPYMIFVDDDMGFEPEDIDKILIAMDEGREIICGLCVTQGDNRLAQWGWNGGKVNITGKPEEVEYASTGFLGISRKALEKITQNMQLVNKGDWSECYPAFECKAHNGLLVSEDYDFCNKARDAGLNVYAHTGVKVTHQKNCILTLK